MTGYLSVNFLLIKGKEERKRNQDFLQFCFIVFSQQALYIKIEVHINSDHRVLSFYLS